MNPRTVTLLGIALLAVGAGIASYKVTLPETCENCAEAPDSGLEWLRTEFSPSTEAFDRIRRLHAAHQVACAGHCEEIARLRGELAALRASGADQQALARKQEELDAADIRCRTSIRSHVTAIAELLGPTQGPRYLSIVLPRLAQFDHHGPPDLELSSPHGPGKP